MARFLFTAWPFAGHIHPCLAIAHNLLDRGHEVAFYSGESARSEIEGEGFPCFPFSKLNEQRIRMIVATEIPYCATFFDRLKNARLLQARFKEWLLDTVPDQVEDIDAVMAAWQPDTIVCDLALWGPFLILHEARRIPVAVISVFAACILPGPGSPAWGQGKARPRNSLMRLRSRLERGLVKRLARGFSTEVNALRARYSLPPLDCSVTEYAGQMPAYLVPSAPAYDYQRTDLPASVSYVGPCLWDKPKQAPAPEWLNTLSADQPLLYVTEATVGTEEPFLLKAAIAAFRNTAFDVVVTTGKQRDAAKLDAELPAPNVRVESYIPQSDLLPRISVMITLGGSGGVLAALKAGVPLVIVPTEWDRPENAQRVVEAGAGIRLASTRCTPERLRAAVERVLADPSFRSNAKRLAQVFEEREGQHDAARILERLAAPLAQEKLSPDPGATSGLHFSNTLLPPAEMQQPNAAA